jgi:hypothetical protein
VRLYAFVTGIDIGDGRLSAPNHSSVVNGLGAVGGAGADQDLQEAEELCQRGLDSCFPETVGPGEVPVGRSVVADDPVADVVHSEGGAAGGRRLVSTTTRNAPAASSRTTAITMTPSIHRRDVPAGAPAGCLIKLALPACCSNPAPTITPRTTTYPWETSASGGKGTPKGLLSNIVEECVSGQFCEPLWLHDSSIKTRSECRTGATGRHRD